MGGASSRLGRDKSRVDLAGQTLAALVVSRLRTVVPEVVLIGKAGEDGPLPDVPFHGEGYTVRCALAGIVRALEVAAGREVLIAACDQPLLSAPVLELLVATPFEGDVHAFDLGFGPEPFPGLYRSGAREDLSRRLEEGALSVKDALRALRTTSIPEDRVRRVDPDLTAFLNVNRPEDLVTARKAVIARRGREQ